MSESYTSPDWYRIADAKPRLRRDVRVARHVYLGRPWMVLSDATSGKVHRLTPAAYALAGRFDGTETLAEIWAETQTRMGEDAPSQDDVVKLISQLHQADLLDSAERPGLADQLERRDKDRGQWLKKLVMNPLSSTIPLIDPDRFLTVLARGMGILPAALWWLLTALILATALAILPLHWAALTDRGLEGFIDLENLLLVGMIYPVVKALHEIGHGLVIKSRGGDVHEMGVMLIAFYPIPYVEASASLAFPSKWARAAVAAAGVAVELVIASLAFFAWTLAEPGLVKTLLFNTMVISGLSTLLVNGNPLLKFDGYHAMADIIEIPNLSKRGNECWGEITRVYVLGSDERDRVPITTWERAWFLLYPPAAFVYRVAITMTIALFVATTYYLLGILLALWSLALTLVWPALKTLRAGITHGHVQRAGRRAVAGAVLTCAMIVGGVAFIPLPHRAVVQGVVWLPEDAFLRTGEAGRVAEMQAPPGALLQPGQPVLQLTAGTLVSDVEISTARLARAEAVLGVASAGERTDLQRAETQVAEARAALAVSQTRVASLTLSGSVAGRFDPVSPDLTGQFLPRGALVGHILPDGPRRVRVVIPQNLVDLLRSETRAIDVRFADDLTRGYPAQVLREVPAGERRLPSAVLSLDGGGPFATVPGEGLQSAVPVFQFDLGLAPDIAAPPMPAFGLRAYVRLSFAPKPLASRAARALRELFLDSFDV